MAMAGLRKRKPVAEMASQKLKQLMWDKLPEQQTTDTIWGKSKLDENDLMALLRARGTFSEMEQDFKTKIPPRKVDKFTTPAAAAKENVPQSFLPLGVRQRMEMILHRVKSSKAEAKHASPEEVNEALTQCSSAIMNETLLAEILANYPESEIKGEMGEYRNAPPEKLAKLHPADQLVVLLIASPFLKSKIRGMLLKVQFEETLSLITNGCRRIRDASDALLHAEHFERLLNIILIFGNYMNGTGFQGGAYGFKVSSINKLVDTKALDGKTLLHFIQQTVGSLFPETEQFLQELSFPVAASRGTF